MQNNNSVPAANEFKALVRDLLGLDPRALVAMDPNKTSVAAGLHELMRRTLERAMKGLWAKEGVAFRLHSHTADNALRAAGWGDARNHNLSALLAHSLLCTPRRVRGQPYIPLRAAEERVVELPRKRRADDKTPMACLVAAVVELFEVDVLSSGPGSLQPMSICALVEEMLDLSPAAIVGPGYDDVQAEVEGALARDAEGQTSTALAALTLTALKVYQRVIAQEDVGFVRILIVNEEEHPNGRYANIMHMLLGALLADGERDVAFVTKNLDG